MKNLIFTLLLLVLSKHTGLGFSNPTKAARFTAQRELFAAPSSEAKVDTVGEVADLPVQHFSSASLAGFITGAIGFVGQGLAADEYELAELPPPYVPALFGVVLLAGVGLLTSSLGNVMDEGKFSFEFSIFHSITPRLGFRTQHSIIFFVSIYLQRRVWGCRAEPVPKKKSNEVNHPTLESGRDKLDIKVLNMSV